MAEGCGAGGGGGKRSWYKNREIKPASIGEKTLLPYVLSVAYTCARTLFLAPCAAPPPSPPHPLTSALGLGLASLPPRSVMKPRVLLLATHCVSLADGEGGSVYVRAVVALHPAGQHAVLGRARRHNAPHSRIDL